MKTKNFVFILMLFIIILNISACFPKKDLNFTYDKLCDGLLRIEYCELTVLDEDQYIYDRDTLLIFDKEEAEYVLQNISNITFEVFYAGPQGLVAGKTIILVYEEYELWIRDKLIEYNWFDGRAGEQVIYTISPNEELQKLIEYIDLNFANK
ncbi:MAG: hypothetical protein IJA15_06245 [Clostridia bacterium]|nr:hypothetical protein [Clostridia bacterium]